jgi:hypothetical protein
MEKYHFNLIIPASFLSLMIFASNAGRLIAEELPPVPREQRGAPSLSKSTRN